MPVNTPSKAYEKIHYQWERCRVAYKGSDAVKAEGDRILPRLDSHKRRAGLYEAYTLRALYYNAMGRTVNGLASTIFQSAPDWDVPPPMEDDMEDVTLTDENIATYGHRVSVDLFITGKYGTLVDMATGEDKELRPYWVGYPAEAIISQRTKRSGTGKHSLSQMVLCEFVPVQDSKDPFVVKQVEQYRVLFLDDQDLYVQQLYRKTDGEWEPWGDEVYPQRRGERLDYIPFFIIGSTGVGATHEYPIPMLDLVDVNLSHYRSMADLEHGRHFTAMPTPWVSGGVSKGEDGKLRIGSGTAWQLDVEGKAGMLEFTGDGLGSLERADEQKRKMMATLGARLLEDAPGQAETLGAVQLRQAGDHATIGSIAQSLEMGITKVLRCHDWWTSTIATREDSKAIFEVRKDFFAMKMTPQWFEAWMKALQAEAVSHETFWRALQRGDAVPQNKTSEEELLSIGTDGSVTPALELREE